jgi:hypothetical protein
MGRVRWALLRREIPHLTLTLSAPWGGEGDRQLAAYHFKDAGKIFHHFAIPKSNHSMPVSGSFHSSYVVLIALHRMLSTIQFDRQFRSRESEIDDRHPNRVLASKPDRDFEFASQLLSYRAADAAR